MKLRRMDRTGPLALVAIQQAMEDARYAVTGDGDDRAGVVLGTYSAGGQATNEYLSAFFQGGPTGAPALLFNARSPTPPPVWPGSSSSCADRTRRSATRKRSGLAAVVTAVDLLRMGRADAVAAGGMDSIYEVFFKAHDQFGVHEPVDRRRRRHGALRRCRRGFVLGEGGFGLGSSAAIAGAPGMPAVMASSSASVRRAPPFRSTPGRTGPTRWCGR